jgi:hypothetical protein
VASIVVAKSSQFTALAEFRMRFMAVSCHEAALARARFARIKWLVD